MLKDKKLYYDYYFTDISLILLEISTMFCHLLLHFLQKIDISVKKSIFT